MTENRVAMLRVQSAWGECERHVTVLSEAARDLEPVVPFNAGIRALPRLQGFLARIHARLPAQVRDALRV